MGIILSGTGTSREFIQRLGRLLRPQSEKAILYEIVSRGTSEVYTSGKKEKGILRCSFGNILFPS